jgi:hypothetical protein
MISTTSAVRGVAPWCIAALVGACGAAAHTPSPPPRDPARPAGKASAPRASDVMAPVAASLPPRDLVVAQRLGNAYLWAPSWYPWYYLWSTGPEDALLATDEASALGVYASACATVPLVAHRVSPLAWSVGLDEVKDGAIIHFPLAAGPPDTLLAHLRCYRVWLATSDVPVPDDSPLLLRGLDITVHAAANTIDVLISARDPVAVPVLKDRLRRTAGGATQPRQR